MDSKLDIISLNKLFKPSDWAKRYSTPEQVISEHITFTKTGKNCSSNFIILPLVLSSFESIRFRLFVCPLANSLPHSMLFPFHRPNDIALNRVFIFTSSDVQNDWVKFDLILVYGNFIVESDRARETIPFEVMQYGNTFTNETFDIYGIDLPKGTILLINSIFIVFRFIQNKN